MRIFDKSPEAQEKKLQGLEMETEVATKQTELEEKKVLIAELKKRHGHDWMHILGVKGFLDLSTLRSLVRGSANTSNLRMGMDISHLRNPKVGRFG